MAKKLKLSANVDLRAQWNRLGAQFRGLDMRHPETWPLAPRGLLLVLVAAAVLTALWFLWLSGSDEELQAEHAREEQLRADYKTKLAKAINLDALKKQRVQVLQNVKQLENQLPSKAEMDALLSDINQAGLGRSLQFELFRPGQVAVKEYYAELPIALRVTGRYHDIGSFAADIAQLSRIVTLNNLAIAPVREGVLGMDATARTYRYLDSEEIAAQRKAAGGKK